MFSRVIVRCWGSVFCSLLCSLSLLCVVLARLMLIEVHSSIEPNPNVVLNPMVSRGGEIEGKPIDLEQ